MTMLQDDIGEITAILSKTFDLAGIERDYDNSFGKIGKILYRYGINYNPKELRILFTLCMQEFFESIPQDQWKLNDPSFVKQSERFAINKFKYWFIEQVT
jgi:hypothetical protein